MNNEMKKRRLRILETVGNITDESNTDYKKNIEVLETTLGIKGLPILEDEVLVDILKDIGDNPIKEPKLSKILDDNDPMKVLEYINGLDGNAEIDFDSMDAMEVSRFIAAISFRITSFTDEEGNMKTTPKTENKKPLSFSQVQIIKEMFRKGDDKLDATILKMSGLKKKDLSEWEIGLVQADAISYAIDVNKTMTGGF